MGIQAKLLQKAAISSKGQFDPDEEWAVYTDSRKTIDKGFFIPLVGDRFDGHDFIDEVIKNGAKGAFWEKSRSIPPTVPETFPLFFVDNTLLALQKSAENFLGVIRPKVVAITGSNGKTTTKDMVEALVKRQYKTHKTEGNLNNHIGLPMTILSMPNTTEVLILEMGMNHFGEIEVLSQIAKPDYALITNIGESHIEFLGSRRGIATAKLEIIKGMNEKSLLIMDGDEPLLTHHSFSMRTLKVGYHSNVDWFITSVVTTDHGSDFTLNGSPYTVPLYGRHNVKNLGLAIALAKELGISEETCQEAVRAIKITGMRFEVVKGLHQTCLINDAYNSSPTSMKAAVETLKTFKGFDQMVAVLGDMFELGTNEEELHRSVAESLTPPITDLVTIGERANWIADELSRLDSTIHIHSTHDKMEALNVLKGFLGEQTVMLFKASRGMKLETLIESLQEEGGRSK